MDTVNAVVHQNGDPIHNTNTTNFDVGSTSLTTETDSCSASAPVGPNESPTKKISIDDSDSDVDDIPEYDYNNGLGYSDHNYDVPNPARRARCDPEQAKDRFPKLGFISSPSRMDSNSRNGTHSQDAANRIHDNPITKPVIRSTHPIDSPGSTAMSSAYNAEYHQSGQRSNINYNPIRADFAFMDSSYGAASVSSPRNIHGQQQFGANNVKRGGVHRASTAVPTPVSKHIGQRFTTMATTLPGSFESPTGNNDESGPPTLQAAPKADAPPHRMVTESTTARVMAPDQAPHRMIQQTRIRMPFNTSDPSQVALANAPAPMVKASRGSKPLIRGRSGSQPSRGKKEEQGGSDDGEEAVGSASSQTASAVASSSPASRKQVHFSDDVSATVNEDTVPAGDGHLIALAEGPCSPPKMQSPLKVPPIPPHRMISSTTASVAITPPRLPKRPVMPPRPQRPVEQRADPHSMPDNIIEDSVPVVQQTSSPRKMLKDTSLPPEVAAMAVEFASKTSPVQPNIDENSDEFIKAKIAAISQEIAEEQKQIEQRRIEHEQMQEKHDQGVGRLRVPGESGGPVVESRGRGRPKESMGRARSSLSGSSALSEGPGDVIPGTSHPWSPSRVQINRKPARPPGSSPVRTNLDFHNRISASDTIAQPAASPARNVNHIPRPVYPIPAPSSGLSTTQLAKRPPQGKGRSVTVAPVPSHSRSDDSDSSEDEHDEQDWGDDYVTRCICGMKHDDGFMVACDQCDVWQHCVCVGLSKDVSEEDYLCEECDPNKHLKYNRSQARDIQKRQLAKLKQRTPSGKGKGAKKSTNATSANSVKSGSRSRSSTTPGKTPISSKKFRESSSNTYSKLSKRMLGLFTPTSNGLTLSRHHRVNKLLVAPGTEGLVSKDPVDEGVAVMELVGHICLPNECTRDAKGASVQQSFVLYDGLADSNSTASMQRESYICIDSRKIGNDSHVVRRCCRPNSVLRHVLENGEIHVYIVTNENLPSTTEITIPFDVDQNPSSDDCSCKDTSDDHCLLLLNADLETGHRDRAAEVEEKKPVDVPKEVKKVERRGRPKKNSSATVPPPKDADLHSSTGSSTRIPKEEKSEEEVVADLKLASSMETSEVDASSSAVSDKRSRRQSGGVKKESEKEESSKEEVKIERTSRSSPKKEVKEEEEHMNYALPADRSKQTREERKLTAQLALIEKIAQKKEKKPKEASTPSSRAKTVAPPTKTPSSRSKTSLPAPAAFSKKTSREAEDTKEGTRSKKKKEVVAEPEPELSSSSPSTVQPPRKRWAAAIQQEEKHASAAVSVAPSDPPSLGGKKQWLKRHAAQSISENDSKDDATLSPDTPHTSASPPSKKGRNQRDSSGQSDDQKREEAANVLAGMGSVREGTESPELFAKLQSAALKLDVTNSMRADFVLPSLSPTGIVLPTAEKTEPKVEATEAPAVQQPEPPAKVSKRISLEDYKRRKSTTAPATTDAQLSPKRERGFIPSMKNLPAGASLLPLHLPGESAGGSGILKSPIESSEKVSIEALKATIYGDQVPSGSLPPPPPPPRVMQSPQDGGNVSTDEEGSTHRLSLAERLRTEFGCGGVASSNAPLAVEPESPAPPPPTSSRRDSRHTSPRGERRRWN